ncbi:MAG TPA: CapA family protein [Candidatus Paceibacterota bacterium]
MSNPQKIKKTRLILWTAFPVFIGIFFASSVLSAFNTAWQKSGLPVLPSQAAVVQIIPKEKKPQYFYANKDMSGGPKLSAKAYIVGDLNTGEVILSKSQDERFPLASVSKLMTALVATEIRTPFDTAQVSKSVVATNGTNGELRAGEKIKTADLLYPLLLESSNDAAEALAEHFGRDSFVGKMNEAAKQLKMTGTSYEDPSGLSVNNKSTVSDMFKLTGYLAKQKPDLLKITTLRSHTIKKQHSWSNISQFLGHDEYTGGKSGYTDPAKQTVVSVFNLPLGETGSRPIGIALLQSSDRKKDVETILKYLKKNIYYGGLADANTNWVQEKVGMPDIKDPSFITLAFAGDIMLDRGVRTSVIKNFNNDYSAIFAKSLGHSPTGEPKSVSDIFKKSDIVFANLEGTASDQGVDQKNLYSFRMDPSVIPALKGAGVSVLSVANNHVGDWGRSAYVDTLARLKENEILYTGGGNNKIEAATPAIIEKYGMKIGFLAFSDKGPAYMKADGETAGLSAQAGLLLASDPNFDKIIESAAKQVDYLVVSFHFGEEYKTKHNARQESLAHRAVDNGAKLVIGAHPHVIQDTEVYKQGYIAYSLGNFVFDQSWSKPTMQGMLLEIKLNRDGSMTAKKNTVQLNSVFQIEKVTEGKEEKVKFEEIKTTSR